MSGYSLKLRANKSIGLVETPRLALLDQAGNNWTCVFNRTPLYGKQVLAANLESAGYDVHIINLASCDEQSEFGETQWGGRKLTKVMVGHPLTSLDPDSESVWGITANTVQEEEINLIAVRHFSSTGKAVVVGGSQAIANPRAYLDAGAAAVVLDKSGGSNCEVLDHILGIPSEEPLRGAFLKNGIVLPNRQRPLHPEEWALPSQATAAQCVGTEYTNSPWVPGRGPIGSCHCDIGCDNRCSFCQTPMYRQPYMRMSPGKVIQWLELQKRAGAKSVMMQSDQFLGRVLFPNGRQEVLDIMQAFRDMGLAAMWCNGLELKKAAFPNRLASGPHSPRAIDEEFIASLCGWDSRAGTILIYVPAERPTAAMGCGKYKKLLPWRDHCEIVKAIVRAGVPIITYGVIIGLPSDSSDKMRELEEAIEDLLFQLRLINPKLTFHVGCFAICPIPGTAQEREIRELGLLAYDEPCIRGGFWTPCANTLYLDHQEVSEWQVRLAQIGRSTQNVIDFHGALSAVTRYQKP